VIDVTTSLREAISERDNLTPKQAQKPEPGRLPAGFSILKKSLTS
jgi:hypothetical protein